MPLPHSQTFHTSQSGYALFLAGSPVNSTPIASTTSPRGRQFLGAVLILFGCLTVALLLSAIRHDRRIRAPADPHLALTMVDEDTFDASLALVESEWNASSSAKLLEILPWILADSPRRLRIKNLLEKKHSIILAENPNELYEWLWSQPSADRGEMARFRVELYDFLSDRMANSSSLADYFRDDPPASIRLDEIRWGGVTRDGIPPIRQPRMRDAGHADFLADTDKVFGVRIGGESRAYPRRILGFHEMVSDVIAGNPVTGVYCPLCETMIVYKNRTANGTVHSFGTSGFLYRSNKLMYDAVTLSLWSTIDGEPVVGRLVHERIELERLPVVTTTWGEWRASNPDTQVLTLEGLPLNPQGRPLSEKYIEDEAYWQYLSSDRLMFPVSHRDTTLKNKDEVFVPRVAKPTRPIAISTAFLQNKPLFHVSEPGIDLVVLTTPVGANRAYDGTGLQLTVLVSPTSVRDAKGRTWVVSEETLRCETGEIRNRIPGHRAFWFAWHAAHPDSRLIR